MAAVSQKVPNLLGGISQQPDPVKLPGQVRDAENVYLDPTFGCRKRPGTELVDELANDVPSDARWFPIFRDNNERYAVAVYNNPALAVRVWDLNDGTERTVTISASAEAYFSGADKDTIEQLTIADYTLMSNVQREVSMASDTSTLTNNEALITIDQIAYNTTYSVDLNLDGSTTQTKVYTATGVEVIPGSYEVEDGGLCSLVDAQNFQESDVANGKSGLSFRLVNQCQAYLAGSNYEENRITVMGFALTSIGQPSAGTEDFGFFTIKWEPYTRYDKNGQTSTGVRGTVRSRQWTQTRLKNNSYTGDRGNTVRVTDTEKRYSSNQRYISRYQVDAVLQNGGTGWRTGDEVTVNMNGRDYTIRVTSDRFTYVYASAGSVSHTTPTDTSTGALDIGSVVTAITSGLDALTDFSAESTGNCIKLTRDDGRDFNVNVRGGTVNSAMTAIKGTARDVSDLPNQCFDQFVLKVANTDDSDSDDYYVKFVTQAPGIPGTGSWEETVAPGIKTTFNASTMPHALVRQADGSFTLDALNSSSAFGGWAPREVGDEVSNPEPSFVGQGISNMFFYANRLGFLTEDAVVMSQPGDYFNFFVVSALTISDADPIDLTASSTKPAILKAAVGAPKGLILFAETSQFLLATSEIAFSAATVKLTEISNYYYKSRVLPLNSGVSVSFIAESNTYSKVMEMATDSVENRPVVADITKVIPEYLPPNFEWGEVMPNNSMLLFGDATEDVYVFKFLNNGDERQLAGWSKWRYPAEVHMFATEDDLAHIVMYDGARHILCTSKLIDDPDEAPLDVGFSKFTPRVDVLVRSADLTVTPYDASNSKITVPAELRIPLVTYNMVVVDGDYEGTFTRPTLETDNTFIVPNDLVADDFIIGIEYESKVTLPSIFLTQENRSDRVNIPQVSFLYLDLYYSGRYQVDVEKLGYTNTSISIEQTAANIYDASNTPVAEISTVSVPIFSRGDIVKTTITAPDPFPSSITGYSWEGTYNNRGISPLS